jgi:Ca-activated chloride channel homolog
MANRLLALFLLVLLGLACSSAWGTAQELGTDDTVIRRVVELVSLNVAVTDSKGNYVSGLQPSDFIITEDGIKQTIATFESGSAGPRLIAENAPVASIPPPSASTPALPPVSISPVTGAKVFVLFDTSNYMYRNGGFVFAQDAIADFVRSLDGPEQVALYSYSRNFTRVAPLTPDRSAVLRGVRSTVNGSDSALYNALLLTLRDAAQYTGKRAVVVFSNGPDNASMVPPENVAELAQSVGVPIYMVSTREARLDLISTAVFERMASNTGGRAFFARSWTDESRAFESVRNDLENLYLLSYYPLPNPNRGWREISVRLAGSKYRSLTVRTRSGYRPLPTQLTAAVPVPPAAR